MNAMETDHELVDFPFDFTFFDHDQDHDYDQPSSSSCNVNGLSQSSSLENSFDECIDFDFIDEEYSIDYNIGLEIVVEETHNLGPEQENNNSTDHHQGSDRKENNHNSDSSNIIGRIQAELMEDNSLTDLLLAGAEAVQARKFDLASEMISKLQQILSFEGEKDNSSFNRLAWFFTQGLHDKISANHNMIINHHHERDHDTEILNKASSQRNSTMMSGFQMLQELSPYVKCAHFTANQAILEATHNEKEIHVIDFDIMEGIQWPPLMVDLTSKKSSNNFLLRLTAVIIHHNDHDQQHYEEEDSVQLTGRRLSEFAKSIDLPFAFDRVVISKDEDFRKIDHQAGSVVPLVANCISLYKKSVSMVNTFIIGVSKLLSPKMIVLVEDELLNSAYNKSPSISFVEFFFEALHHFTALSDSLLSCFHDGAYGKGFGQIEKEFLGPRILDSLRHFPNCDHEDINARKSCNSSLILKKGDYKRIGLSSSNVSQAKFLVSLFRGRYWVQNENCRLALCWKSRPLTKTSIWVPRSKKRKSRP